VELAFVGREPAAGSTPYAPHINWQAIDLTRQF
jgi:hypothetical protein